MSIVKRRIEGRDFWFITEKYEGHGFGKEENRIAFYQQIDNFLKTQVLAEQRIPTTRLGPLEILDQPVKKSP